MKRMNSRNLLEQLEADTRQVILSANYLLQEDPELLTQQPAPGKWSIAQVIEHMNSYGRYYIPHMKKVLEQSNRPVNAWFTPGWLGEYFTKSMLPREGTVKNKMKSPNDHRPSPDIDSKKALDEFLHQQMVLLQLLEKAKQTDINKLRIPISIAKFITIKLGDTFRFFIAHEQRHMVQVKNIKQQ
jgi:DinB superfamily